MRLMSEDRTVMLRFLFRIFLWSALLNYPWEMLQMPLFQAMKFTDPMSWLICFRASLGDGIIILSIWGFGYLVFRRITWFRILNIKTISVLLISGAAIAIGFEIYAIGTGRWEYSEFMPLIPLIRVGLSPFLQLLILPWVSMILASRGFGADEGYQS